jgi:RNA polymerase-associated protein
MERSVMAVTVRRSVMTLFSDPRSIQSHRVRLVLAEKHVTVDIVDADPLNLPEDVIDVNPYGTLPTLLDRDLALYEARIIMEYLDERYPHPPLLPVDPVARATTRLYMYRVERDWYGLADQIVVAGKAAAKPRKELRDSLVATAPVFSHKPYFMNDEFTLVDATIAPLLWRLPFLGIELPPGPARIINTYALRLFQRDSFRLSLTEAEREMRPLSG